MEFSFDVRDGGQEGRRAQTSPRAQAGGRPMPQNPTGGQGGSDPASDRLRKAIERNRAKQAKRDGMGAGAPAGQAAPSSQTSMGLGSGGAPRGASRPGARMAGPSGRLPGSSPTPGMGRPSAPPQSPRQTTSRMSSQAGMGMGMEQGQAPRSATTARARAAASTGAPASAASRLRSATSTVKKVEAEPIEEKKGFSIPGFGRKKAQADDLDENLPVGKPTRKSVAKPENTEFLGALRKSPKKSPASVGYSTAKRKVKTKKKGQQTEEMAISYLVKFAWGFACFLLLRLIFSEGGVMDYYAGENLLNDKLEEYQMIQNDNKNLATEIDKIRYDKNHQKKLVRDNLGYIARDEYLILFPKNKISSAR